MQNQKFLFGVDQFLQHPDNFHKLRFALVTNNSATTSDGILSRVALLGKRINIIRLFSPEHGLKAEGEDGVSQNNIIDPVTGIPAISLYGDSLKPSKKDLDDVDAVLFDVPDAGCRFYSYLWTMTYVMEACAEHHKPLLILDRPNPLGGDFNLTEGPLLDESHCASFIGRWAIPVRHCCTLGELASYFAETRMKDLELRIIKAQNWKGRRSILEAGWFFIPPSPAIRDGQTALLYPGIGMLEGINVNEGRGTKFPFRIFGAPWIDSAQVHEAFESLQLPGITGRPYSYKPTSGIYAEEWCNGLHFEIVDVFAFRPVKTGLKLIELLIALYPQHCQERLYKTTANPTGEKHLDKLTGIYQSFETLKKRGSADLKPIASSWRETLLPYVLY